MAPLGRIPPIAFWPNGVYICRGTMKIFPYLLIHNKPMPNPDNNLIWLIVPTALQIDANDAQIDPLAHELHELTKKDIMPVEETFV